MSSRSFFASVAAAIILAACGQTTPTPTAPAPIPTALLASPTAVPTPGPQQTPAPTPAAADVVTSYPPAVARELVSQGFYLPGMVHGAGQDPQRGGTLTVSNRADLGTSDPLLFTGISNDNILSSLHGDGGLLRAKASNVFEPEPYVAESWTAEDGFKSWTFKLRQGVNWHDGKPVTAEDVKFWIDLAVTPPAGRRASANALDFGPLKEVQVVDPRTVRLVQKEPVPHLLETLYRYSNVMAHPKHLAQPQLDAGNLRVAMADMGWVSLGPFKFESYEKASSFKVTRWDGYFLKDAQGRTLPYLDGVYYPVIPDPVVAVSAFRAGRLDGTSRGTGHHLTPAMVEQIKKSLGERAWLMRLPYTGWSAGTNALKPPFDNIKLRQALHLFTDRQEHIQLVYGGFALASDLMVPGSFWADPTFAEWPGLNPATKEQDRAEAKRLLKEAGLEGAAVTVTCRDGFLANCQFLDLQLRGLGLATKIETFDQLRMQEVTQSGSFQVQIATIGAENPDQALLAFLTTNPLNTNKHGDSRVDAYHQQIVASIDPAERRRVLWEAQRYLIQEMTYVQPWPREEALIAYRTRVKGLAVPSAQVHYLNDMGSTWIDGN